MKFETNEINRLNEKIRRQAKQKLIVDTVSMARKLEDGILTFTDKIIDKKFKERIKEKLRMTQIAQMFIEEGRQEMQQQYTRILIFQLQ